MVCRLQLIEAMFLALMVSVVCASADGSASVGRRLVVVVGSPEGPSRVVVLLDGERFAERTEPPFAFAFHGSDLGEGRHELAVDGWAKGGRRNFGRMMLNVDPNALHATTSRCLLFGESGAQATPPVSRLLPALEKGSEPLLLMRQAVGAVGHTEELRDARDWLTTELEAWGGAVLELAERLGNSNLRRAIALLAAYTEIDLATSLSAKALQMLARFCDEAGDYERGIEACQRLAAALPENEFLQAEALLRKAYCLHHNTQREPALETLREVSERYRKANPQAAAIAQADLALIEQFSKGHLREAIGLTREAVRAFSKKDPVAITLQARIGMYYQAMGDLERALVEYKKVPPGRGSDPSWTFDCRVFVPTRMAAVLKKLGRGEESKQVLKQAIDQYRADEWVVRRLQLALGQYTQQRWAVFK